MTSRRGIYVCAFQGSGQRRERGFQRDARRATSPAWAAAVAPRDGRLEGGRVDARRRVGGQRRPQRRAPRSAALRRRSDRATSSPGAGIAAHVAPVARRPDQALHQIVADAREPFPRRVIAGYRFYINKYLKGRSTPSAAFSARIALRGKRGTAAAMRARHDFHHIDHLGAHAHSSGARARHHPARSRSPSAAASSTTTSSAARKPATRSSPARRSTRTRRSPASATAFSSTSGSATASRCCAR